jgi:signal transduction histidine kinase/CheY-like chemotaxis protein
MKRIMLNTKSIRRYFPLIAIFGAVLCSSVAYALVGSLKIERLKEKSVNDLRYRANLLAKTIDWWNDTNATALTNLARQSEIVSMDSARQELTLKNFVGVHQGIYLAGTVDTTGKNIARSDQSPLLNYSDRAWFLAARSGKELVVQSLISRTLKSPASCMSTPIKNETLLDNSSIVGVVFICRELSQLNQQIGQMRFGKTGMAIMVDEEGQVIGHPNSAFLRGDTLKDLRDYEPVENILSGGTGIFEFQDRDKIDWVSFGIPLNHGWKLVVLQQRSELYQEAAILRSTLGWVVLPLLGYVFFVAWFSDRWVRNWLKKNRKLILEMARDDWKPEDEDSNDEFSCLTDSVTRAGKTLHDEIGRLKQELDRKNSELSEFRKVATEEKKEREHYLAYLGHELRSPFSSIITYANGLREEKDMMEEGERKEGMYSIVQCASQGLNLVESILDYLRDDAMEIKQTLIEWKCFIKSLFDVTLPLARAKAIELVAEQSANFPERFWFDEQKLRQILLNLLVNAIKFTERGSVKLRALALELEQNEEGEAITFQKIVIEVIDTGCGIEEVDQDVIFNPFKQLNRHSNTGGIGLGLAIVDKFVRVLGGTLALTSKPLVGSTFCVEFRVPLLMPQESSNDSIRVVPEPSDLPDTVLIVEDENVHYQNLKSLLQNLLPEYDIVRAKNGRDALSLAPRVKPSLVFLDLNMPEKTGFTTARELRPFARRDAPIILTSSMSESTLRDATKTVGADAYLPKPVTKKSLGEILERFRFLASSITLSK